MYPEKKLKVSMGYGWAVPFLTRMPSLFQKVYPAILQFLLTLLAAPVGLAEDLPT